MSVNKHSKILNAHIFLPSVKYVLLGRYITKAAWNQRCKPRALFNIITTL